MKKWKNLLIACTSLSLLGLTVLPVVSCSNNNQSNTNPPSQIHYEDEKVSQIINEYRDEYNKLIGDSYFFQYTDENVDQLVSLVNHYLHQVRIIDYYNLSIDGEIWLNSFLEELETKKELLSSKIHYLIVDYNDNLGFTNYSSWLANRIQYAINKQDDETILKRFNKFIDKIMLNLKNGLTNNITLSQIVVKHAIGNLLQKPFGIKILNTLVPLQEQIKFDENTYKILETNKVLPFQIKDNDSLIELKKQANTKLYTLLNYLTGSYYSGILFGKSNGFNQYVLQRSTKLSDVEDNGYALKVDNQTYYLNGLGLSNDDLNTKDIGIGFMKSEYGKIIYKALLKKHSNTNKTPKEIFDIGVNGVNDIKKNMEAVARIIAEIYVGKNQSWSPKGEFYDPDSSGNEYGSTNADSLLENIVDNAGNVNLEKFFIWMNTNRWFNGRDMLSNQFPTIDGKTPILSLYKAVDEQTNLNPIKNWDGRDIPYQYKSSFISKNLNITSLKIADVMGDQNNGINDTLVDGDAGNLAYKYLVLGLSPATIQISNKITNLTQTNSISPEAAFIGTSNAILQYLQFKDVSVNHINKIFKNTSVDYTLRTGTGGAAYASSGKGSNSYVPKGSGGFYLDTNPYFGLQKWSMSTLAIHEGVSGHVYQFNYAYDHPSVSYAPRFSSTAYSEGWGLFSEWLAIQAGMYGQPAKVDHNNKLPLPQFGVNSQNIDVSEFKNQYDYANGAYWIEDDKSTEEIEQAANSQKLYDAVQYFGFLNERQLRAMRCAVDVGIHAGGATIKNNGDVEKVNNAGEYIPNTGWSLNDARNYLQKNSGLGIDDIKRETKRYLEYTAQAVSYYNGLVVIEDAYLNASKKYETNFNNSFLDWNDPSLTNDNTAGLFDIILRNGSIPLTVLSDITNFYILNNYNKL